MTGGSYAHQRIVINLWIALANLLRGRPLLPAHEMRLRIGRRIRYPDVAVCAAPLDQTMRTLTDAVAIFEVLSNDTATTDRVTKLADYADVASARVYVLLEQTCVAATMSGGKRAAHGWRAHIRRAGWNCPASTSLCHSPRCTRG